jgi:hypothetical protein
MKNQPSDKACEFFALEFTIIVTLKEKYGITEKINWN